jgi:hypothetical protein
LVGRQKDLIISGGYNVYAKEVENVFDGVPGVVESAIIGVPHPDFGEAVKRRTGSGPACQAGSSPPQQLQGMEKGGSPLIAIGYPLHAASLHIQRIGCESPFLLRQEKSWRIGMRNHRRPFGRC